MLKCLTGLEPKFTKPTKTKSLSFYFAPLSSIHFNILHIHVFIYIYRKNNAVLIMVPVNVCMYMYVCVPPCSVGILFKMFPVLPKANIFLLIRPSICYCIYSNNTERYFLLEISQQKEFTAMNLTIAFARHYTAPQPLREKKCHKSALIRKLCKPVNGVLCFQQA